MAKRHISLAEGAVLLLVTSLAMCMFALVSQEQRATEQLQARVLKSARVLVSFSQSAHVQYSQSIQSAVEKGRVSLSVNPMPANSAIHFPATFSKTLSERFSNQYPDAHFRIYSNDPFEASKDRQLDDFARNALTELIDHKSEEHWQIEELGDGMKQLRLAVPIVMNQNCVACHNKPSWNLEKQNWKPGDVRGAREVSLSLPVTAPGVRLQAFTLFGLISVSCALGLFLVFPAVRREVVHREQLESLADTLSDKASELHQQTITDAQTGLHNRDFFDKTLSAYVSEFAKHKKPLALITFDIDHFKSVNDTHGHDVGDLVIVTFAQCLKGHVRQDDIAARIGGEEFAVIVPHMTHDDVCQLADRIRNAAGALRITNGNVVLQITVSAGVAVLGRNDTPESLRKRSDQMLYKAKNGGRNRICA